MGMLGRLVTFVMLSSSVVLSTRSFADEPTTRGVDATDVVATQAKIKELDSLITFAETELPTLEQRMEMTYLNRIKSIWYNDLTQTGDALAQTTFMSGQVLNRAKRLEVVTDRGPVMLAKLRALKVDALAVVEHSKDLTSHAGVLRYWKDRVVNELGSATYMTLDERDLIDAIDEAAFEVRADAEKSLEITSTLIEKLSRP